MPDCPHHSCLASPDAPSPARRQPPPLLLPAALPVHLGMPAWLPPAPHMPHAKPSQPTPTPQHQQCAVPPAIWRHARLQLRPLPHEQPQWWPMLSLRQLTLLLHAGVHWLRRVLLLPLPAPKQAGQGAGWAPVLAVAAAVVAGLAQPCAAALHACPSPPARAAAFPTLHSPVLSVPCCAHSCPEHEQQVRRPPAAVG